MAQACGDFAQKDRLIDGLGEAGVAAGIDAVLLFALEGVGGEGDDLEGVLLVAEFAAGGVAVHHGHLHVHEDEVIGLARVPGFEGLVQAQFAVLGDVDGGALLLEDHRDEALVVGTVFDKENRALEGAGGGLGGGRW